MRSLHFPKDVFVMYSGWRRERGEESQSARPDTNWSPSYHSIAKGSQNMLHVKEEGRNCMTSG